MIRYPELTLKGNAVSVENLTWITRNMSWWFHILTGKKENQLCILYKLTENRKYRKFKLENSFQKNLSKLKINLDFDEHIVVEILNYEKKADQVANINAVFYLDNDEIKIDSANYSESKSLISLNKLV